MNKGFGLRLSSGAYLGLLSAVASVHAHAQNPPASSHQIEEVIVTAQKRAESLQEAPLAITAFPAETIEKLAIDNAADLMQHAPNVEGWERPGSSGDVTFAIRGFTSGGDILTNDPANGIYIDGVYLGKSVGSAIDIIDLERIEVLRGPQGTLYGRNSVGGAISFVTAKPTGEWGMKTTVSAGNFDYYALRTSVNFPAVDLGTGSVSSKFSFTGKRGQSQIENSAPGIDGYDNTHRDAYRLQLQWDVSDAVSIHYAYDRSDVDEEPAAVQLLKTGNSVFAGIGEGSLGLAALRASPAIADNGPIDPATIQSAFGIPPEAATGLAGLTLINPLTGLSSDVSVSNYLAANPKFFSLLAGQASFNATLAPYVNKSRRDDVVVDFDGQRATNDTAGHALTINWHLQDLGALGDVTLKSITAQRGFKTHADGEQDGTPFLLTYFLLEQEYDQFSQELQAVGLTLDDRLEYVAGIFYFQDDAEQDGIQFFFPLDLANPFPLAAASSPNFKAENESLAVYSQFAYTPPILEERLKMTAGARYTLEQREVEFLTRNGIPGQGIDSLYPAVDDQGLPLYGNRFDEDYDQLTWLLNASYRWTDDLSGYASISTGYRSGGFNGRAVSFATQSTPYDEETLTNYELGLKSEWWDRRVRLNIALWYAEFDDIQIPVFVPSTTSASTQVVNAGSAERWGSEVELLARLTERLTISASYGYIHGDFEEFIATDSRGGVYDASDIAQRPDSSDNSVAVNVDYVIANTAIGELGANISMNWHDGLYPLALDGEDIRGDEATLFNARLSMSQIRLGGGTAQVALWIHNAFDHQDRNYGINFGELGYQTAYFNSPRTYGIDLSYEF